MPTVMRVDGYRFFFYSNESSEPAHIHVESAESECKYWLLPVSMATNSGFNGKELRRIRSLVEENREFLVEAWNEYFGE